MLINNANEGYNESDDHYTKEFFDEVDKIILSDSKSGKLFLQKRHKELDAFQANYLKSKVLKKRIEKENAKLSDLMSHKKYVEAVAKIEKKLTAEIDIELPVREMEYKKCYFSVMTLNFLIKSVLSGKTTTEAYKLLLNDEPLMRDIKSVIKKEDYGIDVHKFINTAKKRFHRQSVDTLENIVNQIKIDRTNSLNSNFSSETIAVLTSKFLGKEYIKFYCQGSVSVMLSRLARSVKYVLSADKLSELKSSLTVQEAKTRDKKLNTLESINAQITDKNRDILCFKKIVTELLRNDPELEPKYIKMVLPSIKQCNGNDIQDSTIRKFISDFKNKNNK